MAEVCRVWAVAEKCALMVLREEAVVAAFLTEALARRTAALST